METVEYYINKIKELEERNAELEEHLKKYTSPKRNKNYYEKHKEEIKQKTKEYKETLSNDKKKEYARKAYLNKKNKIQMLEQNENENI